MLSKGMAKYTGGESKARGDHLKRPRYANTANRLETAVFPGQPGTVCKCTCKASKCNLSDYIACCDQDSQYFGYIAGTFPLTIPITFPSSLFLLPSNFFRQAAAPPFWACYSPFILSTEVLENLNRYGVLRPTQSPDLSIPRSLSRRSFSRQSERTFTCRAI